jgi:hypothetical protein
VDCGVYSLVETQDGIGLGLALFRSSPVQLGSKLFGNCADRCRLCQPCGLHSLHNLHLAPFIDKFTFETSFLVLFLGAQWSKLDG